MIKALLSPIILGLAFATVIRVAMARCAASSRAVLASERRAPIFAR